MIPRTYIYLPIALILLIILASCSSTDSSSSSEIDQADIQATVDARVKQRLGVTPASEGSEKPDKVQGNTDIQSGDQTKPDNASTSAQDVYPQNITGEVLKRRIPWPNDFDRCLSKVIDMDSLRGVTSFPNEVHAEAAKCLSSLKIDPESLIASEMTDRGSGSSGNYPDPNNNQKQTGNNTPDYGTSDKNQQQPARGSDQGAKAGDFNLADRDLAQKLYPPNITYDVLNRRIPWPEGFEACISQSIDMNSLSNPDSWSGQIHDHSAICLLGLDVDPMSLIAVTGGDNKHSGDGIQQPGHTNPPEQLYSLKVTKQTSNYAQAVPASKTSFTTGQDASLWMSGFGFNKSGGASVFNHPVSIASDGTRLAVTDRNNNRIMIWNSIPSSNVPADIVLGQQDFETQMEGSGLDELDFPGQVSMTPDGKVLVADSNNNRILVWSSFPTVSGQAADYSIDLEPLIDTLQSWPWGVWTNGEKVVVAVTGGGDNGQRLILWNSFPNSGSVKPDLHIKYEGMGTPRMIVSNGEYILVGDENGKTECRDGSGSHIWASWPTKTNQAPDACLYGWVGGTIVGDKLIAIQQGGETLAFWDQLPTTTQEASSNKREALPGVGHRWLGGDGNDAAYIDGKLFIVEYNGGRVSVFDELPSGPDEKPDWSLGVDSPDTNPYYEDWLIQNGVPGSNGERLFVSSGFDRSLSVWNKIPGESGAIPDLFYRRFENAPWDISVFDDTVFLAGKSGIYGWENFDGTGALPEIEISDNMGSVELKGLRGVTYNGQYFALSSEESDQVWIWEGIPAENDEPKYILDVPEGPGRLDSDSEWLVIAGYPADQFNVKAIRFDELADGNLRHIPQHNVFPQSAALTEVGFFITLQGDNQVVGWNSIEDALAGKSPDVTLGSGAGTKAKDAIKMANAVDWDGSHLWVGEFKFSTRMLAFAPTEE